MKDDTSTPTPEGSSPNEFERAKPGTAGRNAAQAAIEEVRKQGGVFVNAVRATRMPMLLTDPNLPGNPIVFANEAFLKLSGYSMDEVLGQQPHFMNGPNTDSRDAARFTEAIRADQDDVIETVQYRKDGSRFVATVLISAFKDEHGHTLNHFMSWLDVTRRAEAEDEIADLKKAQSNLRASEGLLRESEERQAFLLKLTDALRPISDAREIQATTARMVGEHLGADRAMYAEVEGDRGTETGTIRRQYVRAGGKDTTAPFPEHFAFGQFGQHTMAARYRGEPLIVGDVQNDPDYSAEERAAWAQFGVRAAVVATLPKGGRLVAEFGVHSTTAREWTEAEITLVKEAAERTWAATERARAEMALRDSEEKYRTLFETMGQGYCELELIRDGQGRAVDQLYLELNPAFERLFGIPAAEAKGRKASQVFPFVDPIWTETFDEVARTVTHKRFEHQHGPLNPWFEVFAYPAGGDRVIVLYEDITDRKRAEAALRESEERQAFLLALGDAMRSEPGPDGKIAVAARLLGEKLAASRVLYAEYDHEKGLAHIFNGWLADGAQPFPSVVKLEDFEGEVLNDLRAGRVVRVDDVGRLGADSGYAAMANVGVQALLSPSLLVDGKLKFNLSIHQDEPRHWTGEEVALVREVSERLWAEIVRARAQQALRESEEKYAGLFAASPAPFLILRPDAPHFTIADVNDAYLAATIRTRDDLVGRDMFEAFPDNPDDAASDGESNLRASLERALVSRRFELMDVQKYDIVRPDGTFEERWWKPANSPVVDVDGNVVAIIHHVADVTAEHRAVEALRASERHAQVLLAELQHRVRNTLAVVRSIARRTAENSSSVDDMLWHFQGRLDAFSRVQAALTRSAHARVSLETLIDDELVAHAARGGRQIKVDGPSITLGPKTAERLSLAIHELTTNSVKHGALVGDRGKIRIRWRKEALNGSEMLIFSWSESGVDIDLGGVRREGFGMELLQRSLPYDLEGTTEVQLRATGLRFELRMPLPPAREVN